MGAACHQPFLHALNVVLLFFLLRCATGFLWRSLQLSMPRKRILFEGASLAPDAAACFWAGRSREAQRNTSGAIEAYRKTLELQPEL